MDKLLESRLFLLDMDGTLNLGDAPLPGAARFLQTLSDCGRRFVYLTNNSSRSSEDYVNRMRGMGFPCVRENVFTSGEASATYINRHFPGKPVYVVGTAALCRELESFGLPLAYAEDSLVLAGFDRELTYEKLDRAVHLLRRGAPFLAANPDWVCPMPGDEVLPDCGSICALLTAASGKTPLYIGKPERRMIDILAARFGVPNEKICCVGDRLYTDVAAAKNAGAVSALVLSGETNREMLEASPDQPDYVFKDVGELANYLYRGWGR